MKIEIPVQNNVEVIIADVFLQIECRLRPFMPPRTTEGALAIQQIESMMNAKIYSAVQEALNQIEEQATNGK